MNKMKKLVESAMVDQAVKELHYVRAASGGVTVHGDMAMIVKKYNDLGFNCVTRIKIYTAMSKLSGSPPGEIKIDGGTEVSSLSAPSATNPVAATTDTTNIENQRKLGLIIVRGDNVVLISPPPR